ncbi:YebC/PmpR family DNA-binding transcriptional regulator [Patescibacteria group bacterium]|nr:YebC/PmpR family DNA-binding transcriptional regulator [Patescibacteria group bacterium]
MSGHNKWSKIKHKKAATDAQKSKIFGKLVRLIQVEAKKCGGDVNSPGLAAAIAKANKENMPKDNIERAIKKASEAGESTPVMYEAYGPGGVGMIVTGLTDNTNRTSSEVKHIFSKAGGSLGAQGSVAWNFTQDENRDWVPNSTIELDEETGSKLENLIETLEDNDDIQDVYHNGI